MNGGGRSKLALSIVGDAHSPQLTVTASNAMLKSFVSSVMCVSA